jgi:hypothetical protein
MNKALAFAIGAVIYCAAVATFVLAFDITFAKSDLGEDFIIHREIGQRFLDTGVLYLPDQLAGPYANRLGYHVLYPPTTLLVIVPLALIPEGLAVIAWYGIPLAVLVLLISRYRPGPWAWVALMLIAFWPRSQGAILYGNSDMLIAAAIGAGVLWGWPAALILLKPSWFLLALVGIRHRSWWVALGMFAIASLLVLPLWPQYVTAMTNITDSSWLQRLYGLPLMLTAIVIWAGQSRDARAHQPDVVVGVVRPRPALPEHT